MSGPGRPEPRPAAPVGRALAVDLAIALAVFALVTLVAELAGAADLGTAAGIGQIAFALTVLALVVRRP